MAAVTQDKSSVLTRLGRYARALGVRLRCGLQDSTRPRVLVLPSYGPDDGASRLRAWWVADELRECGWRSTAVPPHLTLAQRLRLIHREQPAVLLMQQARHS